MTVLLSFKNLLKKTILELKFQVVDFLQELHEYKTDESFIEQLTQLLARNFEEPRELIDRLTRVVEKQSRADEFLADKSQEFKNKVYDVREAYEREKTSIFHDIDFIWL